MPQEAISEVTYMPARMLIIERMRLYKQEHEHPEWSGEVSFDSPLLDLDLT